MVRVQKVQKRSRRTLCSDGPSTEGPEKKSEYIIMQNHPGTKLTGEETAGKPPQEPPSPHKLRSFQDVLDIVFSLSDESRRTLSSDGPSKLHRENQH
ncbi:hypothetical protein MHYP_G00097960 [Metynnis hypsauchen]